MDRSNKVALDIFGSGAYGKATKDALKVSAAVAPFALLLGYLHRSWGAGASKELSKSEKVIKGMLTIAPGDLPRKEGWDDAPKSILLKQMRMGGPILTAGAMYLLGIKAADKHRNATLGKHSKRDLSRAEGAYNKALYDKLYHKDEEAPAPVEQAEETPLPFQEYAKAAADAKDTAKETVKDTAKVTAKATPPTDPNWISQFDKTLGWIPGSGAAAVGASGLAVLAYLMGKRWADINDPNRKRAKEIRSAIEQRATRRWVPKLVIDDPDTQEQLTREHTERMSL